MEEILIKYLNDHNGYIETKDFEKLNISRTYIPKFIKLGIIRKVSRGLYIDSNRFEDEYFILQKKYKKLVFSYNTAFYLLNMTERTPMEIDVTIIKNYHIFNEDNVKVHYVTKDNFNIGIIEVLSPFGNKVMVYNCERCICDMIKNNHSYELELYNKILNNYINSKNKDLDLLLEYAKKFKIYDKVISIMEVLIK